MKRIVDIYVESISGSGNYSKLELFNDEKIEITSSIQNIQDISKVYTDFTQSFTIPASPNNNAILHHFYQSDVDIPNHEWNFNYRIRARIEIDLVPFRTGTIMMEKSNIKNGKTDSYTITFYGDLVSLKDKFGESKLSDLDLTAYDFEYTGANVISKVTGSTPNDVMFPLISSSKVWTYNDGTSTDVKTSAGAINYSELFPAIRVRRIFEAIQTKFGVTFNSTFFTSTDDRWNRLYLWLKNEETYSIKTSTQTADIVYPNGQLTLPAYSTGLVSYPASPGFYFDASLNTFTAQNIAPFKIPKLQFTISSVSDSSVTYYIDLYRDGKVIKTISTSGTKTPFDFYNFLLSDNGKVFQVKVRSEAPMSLKLYGTIDYGTPINVKQTIDFALTTTTANTDLQSKMPEMTIANFFSGILKMFNATCYATSVDVFTIEPLDTWYSQGNIFDITTYTDIDSIDIERQNIYKKLSFKFEKSESLINRRYAENTLIEKEYADTSFELSNEGTDFTIQLPFENLLMNSFDKASFDVGFCLTKGPDFKSYIPKPILLYHCGYLPADVYLKDSSAAHYSNVNIFNNDVDYNSVRYSLTWHPEYDTQSPNLILENNLYATYYNSYLQNLFNPKSRLVRLKAHFPLSLITKLRLNDRLIVRDKRYIINYLKSDITSGEVNLTLINDFRPMINPITSVVVPSTGGTIPITWNVPNGVTSTTFSSPVTGVTFSTGTITSTSVIDVTIPANTNTPFEITNEANTFSMTSEDGYNIVNEQGTSSAVPIDAVNTNTNGTTFTTSITLNQV